MKNTLTITFLLFCSLQALSQNNNNQDTTTSGTGSSNTGGKTPPVSTVNNRSETLTDTIWTKRNKNDGSSYHYHIRTTTWHIDTSECEYNGWTINTHFNLPLFRYNFTPPQPGKSNLQAFSSAGFGVAINNGRINISDDNTYSLEHDSPSDRSISFKNNFGFSLGCLVGVSNSSTQTTVFAPSASIQLLDIQIGMCYELGDVANSAHRWSFALAYGLALSKLTDVGSWLLSNPVPFSKPSEADLTVESDTTIDVKSDTTITTGTGSIGIKGIQNIVKSPAKKDTTKPNIQITFTPTKTKSRPPVAGKSTENANFNISSDTTITTTTGAISIKGIHNNINNPTTDTIKPAVKLYIKTKKIKRISTPNYTGGF